MEEHRVGNNVLSLDVIKTRNKSKETPKRPKHAPFLLPAVTGLDIQFDVSGTATNGADSKLMKNSNFEISRHSGSFWRSPPKLATSKTLNPSMLDYEICALSPLAGGSINSIKNFLAMLMEIFNSNESFELDQAYLALCLKVHEEIISENVFLVDILGTVEKKAKWKLEEDRGETFLRHRSRQELEKLLLN
jgi:U3 small nucleolar RNA-associated protein 21